MTDLHKQGWKIIYLKRENILRQAISQYIVKLNRKKYKKRASHRIADGPFKVKKIWVDCHKLINLIKWLEDLSRKEKEILEGLPYLTIVYERDLLRAENHQNTLNRVFDYLEVSSAPVKTDFVRMSTDRLADSIQNYEEVKRVIGNTEYAKFLTVE